ncbi:glutamate racemase [Hydrogenophaga sp. 5NK40-0174]|uniref:glutamate racemase n=1 Tax=Hydrogenophaga sp. 5NK40-0174 TaxID=3127649 RepID=UPI0031030A0F
MKTIGVYDSGVGGLSVLKALMAEVPDAQYVYVADTGFAPYGEKPESVIRDRAHFITQRLREEAPIDALVVACNTATAHAIDSLRLLYPDLPFIGVEPAIKPAAALTRSGHIAMLGTAGTVGSQRYRKLCDQVQSASPHVHIHSVACNGLADAIENGRDLDVRAMLQRYLDAAGLPHSPSAAQENGVDVVVLGCTHYPFASDVVSSLCGPGVTILENGQPVARRVRSVLGLTDFDMSPSLPTVTLHSTGTGERLSAAASRWLQLDIPAQQLRW